MLVSKEIYHSIINTSQKLGVFLDQLPECEKYSEKEIVGLYQKLVDETDENIGIHLGRVFEFSDGGVFGEIAQRSLTVLKMIKLTSFFQSHLCNVLNISISTQKEEVEVCIKLDAGSFKSVSRQIHDFHIFAFLSYIKQTYSKAIRPKSIIFSYQKPKNLELYNSLGVHYSFDGAQSKIIFNREDLNLKNPLYSEGDFRLLKRKLISYFVSDASYIAELQSYIESNLGKNKISLLEFTKSKGISLRRIERELQNKGICFGDLVIESRLEKLHRIISTSLDFSEIAHELGLYDQASLNNFTMKYIEKTPLELRSILS